MLLARTCQVSVGPPKETVVEGLMETHHQKSDHWRKQGNGQVLRQQGRQVSFLPRRDVGPEHKIPLLKRAPRCQSKDALGHWADPKAAGHVRGIFGL